MATDRLAAPLRYARVGGYTILAALTVVATGAMFAESYRGLYEWATVHQQPPNWAAMFPLAVDTFVAAGEIALFLAIIERFRMKGLHAGIWAVVLCGLTASVAANAFRARTSDPWTRVGWAAYPLAASVALAISLLLLKLYLSPKVPESPAGAGGGPGRRVARSRAASQRRRAPVPDAVRELVTAEYVASGMRMTEREVARLVARAIGKPESSGRRTAHQIVTTVRNGHGDV